MEQDNLGAIEFFDLSSNMIKTHVGHYSAQTLAYLGDAVFEVLVRSSLLKKGNMKVGALNTEALKLVKATAQSEMYHSLLPLLSDEEISVLKRGRNTATHSRAKSATMSEYRHATGVEALFGYLYIKGSSERILELFSHCDNKNSEDNNKIIPI